MPKDRKEQEKSIDKMHNFIDLVRPYVVDLFEIIKDTGFMIPSEPLEENNISYYVIGDAVTARRALNATAEAAKVAREI